MTYLQAIIVKNLDCLSLLWSQTQIWQVTWQAWTWGGWGGGGLIVHWNHENSQLCSYLVSSITNCSCWCSCGILMKGLRLPEYKHSVSYILHVVDYIMARLTLTLASVRKCKLLLSFHWNKTSLAKRLQNLMKNTCTLWDFVSSVSIGNERGK